MRKKFGRAIGIGVALSVMAASLTTVCFPARADEAGAVAAGLLGGLAVGAIAGSAIAGAAPPPPPYGYYYAPAYAPPPRCWWQPQEVWNGYNYVVEQVRVCQ
jgi:hypothetical protein